jgi:enterochelin esterase-like enzyme
MLRRRIPGGAPGFLVPVVVVVLLFAAAVAAAQVVAPVSVVRAATAERSFRSGALRDTLHYVVRLPPGYARSGRRYPVICFLHGLPAGPTTYRSLAWVGPALDRAGRQAILVFPQGTRRQNGDPEYHNWGPGHDWATAIGHDLVNDVDAHYRTIRSRAGRAIVGVSAGGYGAASIGLKHPAVFSVVESWSGYFEPTDPTGLHVLDLGSAEATADASVHVLSASLHAQFARAPTYFAFYVGTGDTRFLEENHELDRELTRAHAAHTFAVYPGGHTTALWQTHATAWLSMALAHLAPASPVRATP